MRNWKNRLLFGIPTWGAVLLLVGTLFFGGVNSTQAGQFAYSGNVEIEGIPYSGSLDMSFSLTDGNGTVYWRSGESAEDTIKVLVERGRYLVILGGQGMSPITPDLLLVQPELFVQVSYAKDGKALQSTVPGRRMLSSPRVLAADLADLADRAVLADSLADGSLTLEMLEPALQERIVRATDPAKVDQIFIDYFGDRYGPKLSGSSSTQVNVANGSQVTLSGSRDWYGCVLSMDEKRRNYRGTEYIQSAGERSIRGNLHHAGHQCFWNGGKDIFSFGTCTHAAPFC